MGAIFTNEIVDKILLDSNRMIKRIGEYKNFHTRIDWQCIRCNLIWTVTPDNILSKKKLSGCPQCDNTNINKFGLVTSEIIDFKLIGRDIKRIDEYIGSLTKIRWQCLNELCNNIWLARPSAVVCSLQGCPLCNTPGTNEKRAFHHFNNLNMNFIHQWSIKNINEKFPAYRVDFFFPNENIILEYNGRQHYESFEKSRFEHKNVEEEFERQVNRDNFVRNVCKEHSIKLIEIDGRKFYSSKLISHLNDIIKDNFNMGMNT